MFDSVNRGTVMKFSSLYAVQGLPIPTSSCYVLGHFPAKEPGTSPLRGTPMPRSWALRAAGAAVAVMLPGPLAGLSAQEAPPFMAPVDAPIVRGYEPAEHRYGRGHRGIDYGVARETAVRASGAGSVSFAGPVAHDGLFVTIQHAGGISTTYSFLSDLRVRRGEQVARGQVVGLSGEGHHDGPPSLHFGAKLDGEYIDPMLLLRGFEDITDLLNLAPVTGPRGPPGPGAAAEFGAGSPEKEAFDGAPGADQSGTVHGPAAMPSVSLPSVAVPEIHGAETGLTGSTHRVLDSPSGAKAVPAADRRAPTNAQLWADMDPGFRAQLLAQDPDRWASYPGLTNSERDQLNRERLRRELEELRWYRDSEAGRAELRSHRVSLIGKPPITLLSRRQREAELDRMIRSGEHLLKQLEVVASRAENLLDESDVYLLDFDLGFAGGDGKAAIALGDPGTAEHVGVLVPGVNNAVGSVGNSLQDAASLRSEVARSVDENLMERTSTIVWMGYDNPSGLLDGINRAEAHQGAPWLKKFVRDLRDGHRESPEAPHITVFGHSYGSVVTGRAGLAGMEADDIVFLGSPGVGRFPVNASDFPQARIWAARTRWDPIAIPAAYRFLGSDPMGRHFGARKIPMDDDQRGHSDYFEARMVGTANLARILTGRFPGEELE